MSASPPAPTPAPTPDPSPAAPSGRRTPLLLFVVLVVAVGGVAWWLRPGKADDDQAKQRLAEADQLAEQGQISQAAAVYREVGTGPSSLANQAVEGFKRLLGEPLDRVPLPEAAALLQMALDWPRRPELADGLKDRGLKLIRDRGDSDPEAALALYDLVIPLSEKLEESQQIIRDRSQRLQGWSDKAPGSVAVASAHADALAQQLQVPAVIRLLEPLREKLGDGEGARLLGQAYAYQGRSAEALALLEPHVRAQMPKLQEAEQKLRRLEAAQERSLSAQFDEGKAPGFDFGAFEKAPEAERPALKGQYIRGRLWANPELRRLVYERDRRAAVVHAIRSIGEIHLARARSRIDLEERQADLRKAEEAFLSLRGTVGDREDVRFSLVQVAYGTGQPEEGRRRLDELLELLQRSPQALAQGAQVLRQVGDQTGARALLEEAYEKEANERDRHGLAFLRSRYNDGARDEIDWLNNSDLRRLDVQALLEMAQGRRAREQGAPDIATGHFRKAGELFGQLPRSAETLSEAGNAALWEFQVSGQKEALERGKKLMEEAIALRPSDGVLVSGCATQLYEAACFDLLIDSLDLIGLRTRGSLGQLAMLHSDRKGRDAEAARVRKQPAMQKARELADRVLTLLPRQPQAYQFLASLFLVDRDLASLKQLEQRLTTAEVDLVEATRALLETYAGKDLDRLRGERRADLTFWQDRVREQRKKGGPTLALAQVMLTRTLLRGEALGESVDPERVLKLAEEACKVHESRGSSEALINALLFRAHRRLIQEAPEYARMAERSRRSLDPSHLIALAAGRPGLSEKVVGLPDVQRSCKLLQERWTAYPDEPSSWAWALLRQTQPAEAERLANLLKADELSRVTRSITLRLNPLNLGAALEAYWVLQIEGKEDEGKELLRRLARRGVPLPFDVE